MNYISAKEASIKWNISKRRVIKLAFEGRIEGAVLVGNSWVIPTDATKPQDKRKSNFDCIHDDKYIFPMFYYSMSPNEYLNNNLSEENKTILSAALLYERLEFDECIVILKKLLTTTTNQYTKIAAYYFLSYAYYGIGDFDKSLHSFYKLKLEITEAKEYQEELCFLSAEAETLFNGVIDYTKSLKLDFNKKYTKEFMIYVSVMNVLTDVYYTLTKNKKTDTQANEILCKNLESHEYFFAASIVHFYMSSIYLIRQDNKMTELHIRKTLELAEKYHLYASIAHMLSYIPNYQALIKDYSSEKSAEKLFKIAEDCKNNHSNCLRFFGKPIMYLDLTHDDYKYISYTIKGFTIDEMAEKENSSLYKVKKNINNLCKKFNATNRKELMDNLCNELLRM